MEDNSEHNRVKPNMAIRVLGIIIGIFFIATGILMLGNVSTGWLSFAGPIGVIGTGIIFIVKCIKNEHSPINFKKS